MLVSVGGSALREASVFIRLTPAQDVVAQILDEGDTIGFGVQYVRQFIALVPQFQIRFLHHIFRILRVARQPEGYP